MRQLLTFGNYLKGKFKDKVYKVPISISGFTCPNIDGTTARGGCTFCENDSFSPSLNKAQPLKKFTLNLNSKTNPFLDKQLLQLEQQFYALKNHFQTQMGANKFLVYFQSFTNTYAPLDTLKALYEKALSFDGVVGLSIGTRSDSITDEILDYLVELSRDKEIWIEYGIQSVFDETLQTINRGHDSKNVEEWIKKTKARGLNVCGHIIYGLPNETKDMMMTTTHRAIDWGIDSIKIHPMYIVKRTALANQFYKDEVDVITQEDYIDMVVQTLQILPENISIQRITAGIDNDTLLAPMWCKNKQQQLDKIRKALNIVGLKY